MRRSILDNDLVQVEEDIGHGVIVITRKNTRAASGDELADAILAIEPMLRPEHRGFGLLMDVRLGPGNNDATFERPMARIMRVVESLFPRVVVLVTSAVGELQARRMGQGLRKATVTRDPEKALALASRERR